MGDFLANIFDASTLGLTNFSGNKESQPQGPSAEEIAAQKKQATLTEAKAKRETAERAARGKIITARAAGPQTLFTRPGQIPRPVKLGGGGQRA